MAEVLSLDNVSVVRGQSSILTQVAWQVSEGERWVVMGPNGAGKSTLIQVCAGYIHPTRGTATILGETLGNTDVRELRTRIGICSTAIAAMLPGDESVFDTVISAVYGMVGRWLGTDVPAVGISIGFERAVDLIDDTLGGSPSGIVLILEDDSAAVVANALHLQRALIESGEESVRLERKPKKLNLLLENLALQGIGRFASVSANTTALAELYVRSIG